MAQAENKETHGAPKVEDYKEIWVSKKELHEYRVIHKSSRQTHTFGSSDCLAFQCYHLLAHL